MKRERLQIVCTTIATYPHTTNSNPLTTFLTQNKVNFLFIFHDSEFFWTWWNGTAGTGRGEWMDG